MYCTVKE
ncbi:putative membrane protein, partial [Escherichia coli 0.1304]